MDESRVNEPPIKLPYREFAESDTKKVPKKEVVSDNKLSYDALEKDDDEVMAKQITKNDLKKQNKLLIVLGSIFTILIVTITTVVLLIPALTTNKEIYVPDVTGYSVEDAIKALQDAGFVVASDQQKIASESVELGKVVKTSPLANTKRTKNTEVTLWVSEGDTKITLENYVGKNYLEVKGKLEALKVNVIVEKKSSSDENAKEGVIIEQSPKEGEKVSVGDYVTLYIPNLDKYPDFTTGTYTASDVKDYLKKYEVTVNVVEREDNTHAEGIVIGQSREKGSIIGKGTSVTITVAKKPTTTPSTEGGNDGDTESGSLD